MTFILPFPASKNSKRVLRIRVPSQTAMSLPTVHFPAVHSKQDLFFDGTSKVLRGGETRNTWDLKCTPQSHTLVQTRRCDGGSRLGPGRPDIRVYPRRVPGSCEHSLDVHRHATKHKTHWRGRHFGGCVVSRNDETCAR